MRESKSVINFRACKTAKELVMQVDETIKKLEEALYDILDANSIEAAKEIAAEALGEDLEIYLEEDDLEMEELEPIWEEDFNDD